MIEVKRKYLRCNLAITLGTLLLTILIFLISGMYGKEWTVYTFIPIIFFFFAIFEITFLWFCKMVAKKPQRLPLSFSVVKGIRFVLLIIFAVFYSAMHREQVKIFLVIFAIYFIIWLCFDTMFFFKNNKNFIGEQSDENK